MAMYRLTITGEWDAPAGRLTVADVTCEFAAEDSVAALDGTRAVVAALLGPGIDASGLIPYWCPTETPRLLLGVLAVHLRFVEAHDRSPVALHWTAS
jgi:hypothetical protein